MYIRRKLFSLFQDEIDEERVFSKRSNKRRRREDADEYDKAVDEYINKAKKRGRITAGTMSGLTGTASGAALGHSIGGRRGAIIGGSIGALAGSGLGVAMSNASHKLLKTDENAKKVKEKYRKASDLERKKLREAAKKVGVIRED